MKTLYLMLLEVIHAEFESQVRVYGRYLEYPSEDLIFSSA